MEEFRWKRCIFYSCHGDSEWFGMIRSDSSSPEDSNKLSAVAFRTECPNQQKIDFKFFNFVAILICQLKIVEIGHESYRMDLVFWTVFILLTISFHTFVGSFPDIKKAVLIELLTVFELVNTKRLSGSRFPHFAHLEVFSNLSVLFIMFYPFFLHLFGRKKFNRFAQ